MRPSYIKLSDVKSALGVCVASGKYRKLLESCFEAKSMSDLVAFKKVGEACSLGIAIRSAGGSPLAFSKSK
jgi:hypothetical protein